MNEKPIVIKIPPVEEWTLSDLKRVCKHNKIKGYTKMSKTELIKHVQDVIDRMKPINE